MKLIAEVLCVEDEASDVIGYKAKFWESGFWTRSQEQQVFELVRLRLVSLEVSQSSSCESTTATVVSDVARGATSRQQGGDGGCRF
eukprot:4504775-Amphidinium_carterae.2